ncbi:hypothetical protein O181_100830 [Austropuccinia psidii MF-1]|uniref:Uncharacterized protein n=1 Tax=Austropuccinia psidii MF-1 TaxID=1389203 RepID=A0A9Q3JGD1_9BASI|nr:hypothetical protein [Austropuccinia psidii MF-1]
MEREKKRGRGKAHSGSNDQKGTYHQENPAKSPMPNQIHPSPMKTLNRCRDSHPYISIPERRVKMEYRKQNFHHCGIMGKNWSNESGNLTQSNDFPKALERDKKLEYQQIFHTLRRDRNLNQRK